MFWKNRRRGKLPIFVRRMRDLGSLIRVRHGGCVPATDDADTYVEFFADHAVQNDRLKGDALAKRVATWASLWAPSVTPQQVRNIVARVGRAPRVFSAESAAAELRVTLAERAAGRMWTIGACDVSRADRLQRAKDGKRQADRIRAAGKRLNAGATPRAHSIAARSPWETAGVSRATWFRQRKRTGNGETNSSQASPSYTRDETVSRVRRGLPAV